MISEQWHTWQPLIKMNSEYSIQSCTNNNFSALAIVLEECTHKETTLHVSFNSIEAYRITNETYKLELWQYLSRTHSNLNRKWPLFVVENSAYLELLSQESQGITDYLHFKHYCIMDSEWVLDIAAHAQPIVELFVNSVLVETNVLSIHL